MRLGLPFVLCLVLASTSTALADSESAKENSVKAEWETLVAQGCHVEKADIATRIEARVLRNTPFAIAGKIFKAPELTELFSDDGNWYKPSTKSPALSTRDKACVAKVKAWGKTLRKNQPMKKKVEAFLTRDRELYLELRKNVPYDKENYTESGGSIRDGIYSWSLSYSQACFYTVDCGAYTIGCELNDKKKVECMLVAAG